jgi:threonine dehydratase
MVYAVTLMLHHLSCIPHIHLRMPPYTLPTPLDVDKAAFLLANKVTKTPVKTSSYLNRLATANAHDQNISLFFKCENLQKTGSFKFRGASHFIAKLRDDELRKGVVTYSTGTSCRLLHQYNAHTCLGNHAQAVAHAAQIASRDSGFHIPCSVCVPSYCPPKKISAARSYGANVLLSGTAPEDRVALATQIQSSTGAILVSPDHADIVLGQATAIQELLAQAKGLDAVIIAGGTGGLLVGAIAVCKTAGVSVLAAEPERGGPGLAAALRSGRRATCLDGSETVADGLRTLTGEANWEHIKDGGVDGMFTVSEVQIKDALRLVVEELGMLVEPSAAVGLAVTLFNPGFSRCMARFEGAAKVGVVLTGGNIGVEELLTLVSDLDVGKVRDR